MDKWFQSDYCKSRQHCKNCRLSSDFRKWVTTTYTDGTLSSEFDCPFGITSDSVQGIFPSLLTEATNVTKAAGRVIKAVARRNKVKVSEEERKRRLRICESNNCKQYKHGRCLRCGCVTRFKAILETEDCPLGYWKKVPGNPT